MKHRSKYVSGSHSQLCSNFGKSEDQSFPIASRVSPELATKGAYSNFEQCPNGKGECWGKTLRKNGSVCWKIQKNATTWVSSYQLLAKVWSPRSWTCFKMSILWQVHFGWYQRCCAEPWLTPWSFWPTSNQWQAWLHSGAVKWEGDFLEILKSGFHTVDGRNAAPVDR